MCCAHSANLHQLPANLGLVIRSILQEVKYSNPAPDRMIDVYVLFMTAINMYLGAVYDFVSIFVSDTYFWRPLVTSVIAATLVVAPLVSAFFLFVVAPCVRRWKQHLRQGSAKLRGIVGIEVERNKQRRRLWSQLCFVLSGRCITACLCCSCFSSVAANSQSAHKEKSKPRRWWCWPVWLK